MPVEFSGQGNLVSKVATYESSFAVVGAAAGDVVEIIGSASMIVLVLEIAIIKPTVQVTHQIIKRSAAATGGTSANATLVPLDSGNPAATAVIKNYSADPTEGAAVGTIFRAIIATTENFSKSWVDGGGQAVVLRGVAQTLCINLSAASNFDCYVRFSEQISF